MFYFYSLNKSRDVAVSSSAIALSLSFLQQKISAPRTKQDLVTMEGRLHLCGEVPPTEKS